MDREMENALIREYQDMLDEERRILSRIPEVRRRMVRSGKLKERESLQAMITGRLSGWRFEEEKEIDVKLFSFKEWLDFVEVATSLPEGERRSWENARMKTSEVLERVIQQFYKVIIGTRKRLGITKQPLAEDMDAEGVIGIVRALERFDFSMGSGFASYCSYWITAMMIRAIDADQTVRLPEGAKLLRRRIFAYFQENESSIDAMSSWDLASLFDVPEELLVSCLISVRSLDAPIDNGEGVSGTFGDLILLDEESDRELIAYDQKVLGDRLRRIVSEMEPDVREAALLRFPFSDFVPRAIRERTLSDAADFLEYRRMHQLKILLQEEQSVSTDAGRERSIDNQLAHEVQT